MRRPTRLEDVRPRVAYGFAFESLPNRGAPASAVASEIG
jgi:hypothetical protein